MRTVAALLEEPHKPVEVVDLDIESPRAGEVMVEIAATGVCHSDLSVAMTWAVNRSQVPRAVGR